MVLMLWLQNVDPVCIPSVVGTVVGVVYQVHKLMIGQLVNASQKVMHVRVSIILTFLSYSTAISRAWLYF